MLHRVTLVWTDVSEGSGASIIRITRTGELGTTLAVTSNRHKSHMANIPEDGIFHLMHLFALQFAAYIGVIPLRFESSQFSYSWWCNQLTCLMDSEGLFFVTV
jgi:hypothetical protein